MGIYVWPVDAVTGAPSYTGRMLRQVQGALWMKGDSTRPLGARSGVLPMAGLGASSSHASISTTTYTITPHSGIIDAESLAIAGPYVYSIDANITGSSSALTAGQYRTDLLCVQISDPAESDGSSVPAAAITYTLGTPNATQSLAVAPATPARSLALATILVPPSGNPTLTWVAQLTVASGGIIPLHNGGLPGTATVPVGTFAWNGIGKNALSMFFLKESGVWQPVSNRGNAAYTLLAGGQFVTGSVSFTDTFGFVPTVVTTLSVQFFHGIQITATTTTGFSYRIFRTPATNAGVNESGSFNWIALS